MLTFRLLYKQSSSELLDCVLEPEWLRELKEGEKKRGGKGASGEGNINGFMLLEALCEYSPERRQRNGK